jgi:RHS repeat-associated protein
VWSYPNLQGHYVATATDQGVRQQTTPIAYDPWGAEIPAQPPVHNSDGPADFGPYGTAGKLEEHGIPNPIVLMGARPYSPSAGRFLSVDPVHGGCANNYTYGFGNPIDHPDLTGRNACVEAESGFSFLDGLATFAEVFCKLASISDLTPAGLGGIAFSAGCDAVQEALQKAADSQDGTDKAQLQSQVNGTISSTSGSSLTDADRELLARAYAAEVLPYDNRVGSAYQIGQQQYYIDCWKSGYLPYPGSRGDA